MDESDAIQNLYDRLEVAEKTIVMLLDRLHLNVEHGDGYIMLRSWDDEREG